MAKLISLSRMGDFLNGIDHEWIQPSRSNLFYQFKSTQDGVYHNAWIEIGGRNNASFILTWTDKDGVHTSYLDRSQSLYDNYLTIKMLIHC